MKFYILFPYYNLIADNHKSLDIEQVFCLGTFFLVVMYLYMSFKKKRKPGVPQIGATKCISSFFLPNSPRSNTDVEFQIDSTEVEMQNKNSFLTKFYHCKLYYLQ